MIFFGKKSEEVQPQRPLISKVRAIEIKARRLSQNIFAGRYHSAFKGRGMAFSEVREYQYGDDVRDIDWNVTARFNRPYIKIFEEERELTVMLLVDVSGSLDFGTQYQTKRDLVTEISATLAFSAIQNHDKIGAIFFSDQIEKYIPPKTGRHHILYIINELLTFKAKSKLTNIDNAIKYLNQVVKRSSTVFIISDFFTKDNYKQSLSIANKKHDVIAIQVYDIIAKRLPNVGLLRIYDSETGKEQLIDTSYQKVRNAHDNNWKLHQDTLNQTFNAAKIDNISIATHEDFVHHLIKLFNKRI